MQGTCQCSRCLLNTSKLVSQCPLCGSPCMSVCSFQPSASKTHTPHNASDHCIRCKPRDTDVMPFAFALAMQFSFKYCVHKQPSISLYSLAWTHGLVHDSVVCFRCKKQGQIASAGVACRLLLSSQRLRSVRSSERGGCTTSTVVSSQPPASRSLPGFR